MSEVWENIPGFEKIYQVSNRGRVRSLDRVDNKGKMLRGIILKCQPTTTGYRAVSLSKNGKEKSYTIHRLVAVAFIRKQAGKEFVNHINGKRTDNRLINLEYCNQRENVRHYYATPNLTNKELLKIRRLRKNGLFLRQIAQKFHLSVSTVVRICKGQGTWKNFDKETVTKDYRLDPKPRDKYGRSKLRLNDVLTIRKLRSEGVALKTLGEKYKLNPSHVCSITTGKVWKKL